MCTYAAPGNFRLTRKAYLKNNQGAAIKQKLTQSINQQISADPRFDRVESLSVLGGAGGGNAQNPTVYAINLSVRLAGSTMVVPIAFTVTV